MEGNKKSSLKAILDETGELTSKDVFEHAKQGDGLANEIVDGTAKALALVCTQMANATDPETIVFAGGMIAAGDFLLERLRHFYQLYIGHLFGKGKIKLCFATLGEDAGIIGTSSLGLTAIEK